MSLWPFKRGDDESFHRTPKEESIYDSIGELPPSDYVTEIRTYQTGKWRKGLIHSVTPAVCYGLVVGLVYGTWQARHTVRHISKPRVILSHMYAFGSIGFSTTCTHHFLVVASGYKTAEWQSMFSGIAGGLTFSFTTATSPSAGFLGGLLIGAVYTITCYFITWYQKRWLTNFLVTQQSRDVPIHRVAPELQPMYRAFLYDHRPIEDTDQLRRRALLLERTTTDTRLDSQAFLEAINTNKFFSWISFPEWWPLKIAQPTDQQALAEERLRDDAFKRRLKNVQDSDGFMTSYLLRSKTALDDKKPN